MMSRVSCSYKRYAAQSGAILLISLVLLLVMTVLAVSNMRSTSMELRMATNSQSRQEAFQTAETALKIVEANLQASGVDESLLRDCAADDNACYDINCAGGLCFSGSFTAGDNRSQCDTYAGVVSQPAWTNAVLDVWNTPSRHQTLVINGIQTQPRYITEFLCFIDDGTGAFPADPNASDPVFRITSLAVSRDGKAQVMLQSTYKIAD